MWSFVFGDTFPSFFYFLRVEIPCLIFPTPVFAENRHPTLGPSVPPSPTRLEAISISPPIFSLSPPSPKQGMLQISSFSRPSSLYSDRITGCLRCRCFFVTPAKFSYLFFPVREFSPLKRWFFISPLFPQAGSAHHEPECRRRTHPLPILMLRKMFLFAVKSIVSFLTAFAQSKYTPRLKLRVSCVW